MYDVALASKSVVSEICRATALSSIELCNWAAVGEYSDAILHAAAPTSSHALTMGGAAAQRKCTERPIVIVLTGLSMSLTALPI